MAKRDDQTLGLFDPPPLPPATEEEVLEGLRWYQRNVHSSVMEAFKTYRSALIVLATGLGKTQCFSAIAKTWPGRVLVLAHREELVEQARQRLVQMTRERIEVEQGPLRSNNARIVVGSVQTVYRQERLERLQKNGGFSLVVVDEAHHYVSPTYKLPLAYFNNAKVLGVTATPDRGDTRALGEIFETVAYTMDLSDGIDQGYLVPLRGREIEVTDINLDGIETVNGDLNGSRLDEEMVRCSEGVVKGLLHHAGDKQAVVFLPGVPSAKITAARLNELKPGSARSVDGETDKEERKRIMEDFRNRQFQFLTNCMVATEGFDAPTASIVAIARPTKSRSLYAQMVGRGTRVLPGTVEHLEGPEMAEARRAAIKASRKPDCLLLDFSGNNTRHALVTPMDLLGGTYGDDVKKRARELQKEAGEMDVNEALVEAKKDLDRVAMARVAAGVSSRVESVSREFNPFKHLDVDMERERKYDLEYGYKAMTVGQRNFLTSRGYSDKELEGVSARAASRIIASLIERTKKGLATKPQAEVLAKAGVTDASLTAKAASAAISYIRNQRRTGQSADPAVLNLLTSTEEF